MKPVYKRVLLKLSGEYLAGKQGFGFDYDVVDDLANQVVEIHDMGVEIGIVIGGGNIFRGANPKKMAMERVSADHMGMLATIINSLCLQEALEGKGKEVRVMTGIDVRDVAEPYVKRRADRHLEKGRIVIFGGGTGNPYFSTDTAAVLRGQEINADVVIKGTKVDGVYDKDPAKNPDAKKYDELTYLNVLEQNLAVMDSTAITFCRDNNLPLFVVNTGNKGDLKKCVLGQKVGTNVHS